VPVLGLKRKGVIEALIVKQADRTEGMVLALEMKGGGRRRDNEKGDFISGVVRERKIKNWIGK